MDVGVSGPSILGFPGPLQRAARTELEKLVAYRDQVAEQVTSLKEQLAHLNGELSRIAERESILRQLIDPTNTIDPDVSGVVLRGSRLRIESARLLMLHHGPDRDIYYRDWYELLGPAGFVVLGKKPLATFLTAIGRSPVVERGVGKGAYRISTHRAAEIERELREARAELADARTLAQHDPSVIDQLRPQIDEMTSRCRRLERDLREAELVLAFPQAPGMSRGRASG